MWRRALLFGMASLSLISSINAQVSASFVRFQASTINKTEYNYIDVMSQIIAIPNGVRIAIANETDPTGFASTQRPTIASVYFDAPSSILGTSPTFNSSLSSSTIHFGFGGSPGNMPGGNEISFTGDSHFTASSPAPKNGINPGEFAYFDFAGSSYNSVVKGLLDGNVRFGLHVLQVGKNGADSLSLVANSSTITIPEPSSLLLAGFGAVAALGRRRR